MNNQFPRLTTLIHLKAVLGEDDRNSLNPKKCISCESELGVGKGMGFCQNEHCPRLPAWVWLRELENV